MQTIIMTIKPVHLRHIRTGIKKGELRKSFPKIGLPFRVLLCESGSGGQIKAEFTCRDIRAIDTASPYFSSVLCLREQEISDYLGGKTGYVWGVSDVVDYCCTKGYRIRNISEFGIPRSPRAWQHATKLPDDWRSKQ